MSIRANHRLYAMAILLANSLLALKKESATLFDKFRKKTATARLIEEQFYEQVVHELQQGRKRDGLWAKALVNSEGSEQKAKSLYIEYRVQSIKDEIQISVVLAEEAKNTAVVEYQKRLNRCMCALESNSTLLL
jgi:FtsZ-interacting cell division protein ZipA